MQEGFPHVAKLLLEERVRVSVLHLALGMQLLNCWLGKIPLLVQTEVSTVAAWKTKRDEILRFADDLSRPKAWTALGSDAFSAKIGQAVSWNAEIYISNLKRAQQVHATRFCPCCTPRFHTPERTELSSPMLRECPSQKKACLESLRLRGEFLPETAFPVEKTQPARRYLCKLTTC